MIKRETLFLFSLLFFFFWEINWGNANKECRKQEINMQNKLDLLFQILRAIGGPNHKMMEYPYLAGATDPMANYLAWHTGPNSRSQIIPRGYDGIH